MLLLILLVASLVTGWLFDLMNVPVGWLLGPTVSGILIGAIRGRPYNLSPSFQMIGEALLGLSVGLSFSVDTLKTAATHAVPLSMMILLTVSLSLLNGYLLWRWTGIDRATGFLGSLPAAAYTMVALSDEMGADALAVAMLQYLRLLMVIFLAPVLVDVLFEQGTNVGAGTVIAAMVKPEASNLLTFGLLPLIGLVGIYAGRWLRIPSAAFMGPCIAALVASWTMPVALTAPPALFAAGLLLIGLPLGARFDLPMARRLGKVALVETGLVMLLILICLGAGRLFSLATGVDAMTAVLGSQPGAMEVMVASATQLGADPGLVLAMQMSRFFLVVMFGPWLVLWLIRHTNRLMPNSRFGTD